MSHAHFGGHMQGVGVYVLDDMCELVDDGPFSTEQVRTYPDALPIAHAPRGFPEGAGVCISVNARLDECLSQHRTAS